MYENQRFLHDLYEKEQNKESECKVQESDTSVVKDDNAGMEVDATTTTATADGDVQEHSADTQQQGQEETAASNMDTDPSTSVQPETAITTTYSTAATTPTTTTALPLKAIPSFPTQPTVFLCPMVSSTINPRYNTSVLILG